MILYTMFKSSSGVVDSVRVALASGREIALLLRALLQRIIG